MHRSRLQMDRFVPAPCRMRHLIICSVLYLVMALAGVEVGHAEPVPDEHSIRCRGGAVVTVSLPATDVGVSILKQEGSAIDAAVATAFALAVTHPAAGNIGGGGYLLVARVDGTAD